MIKRGNNFNTASVNMMVRKIKLGLGYSFIVVLLASLSACGSAPATRFYTLYPESVKTTSETVAKEAKRSIGIGPISLPGYLDNTSIVSRNTSQRINISGLHAWASELDASMTRVLVSDISQVMESDNVWGFPWDMRARPDIQVAIVVEQFDGPRDGEVVLSFKWNAFNVNENKRIDHGYFNQTVKSASKSYNDYVRALNEALHQAAEELALVLAQHQ